MGLPVFTATLFRAPCDPFQWTTYLFLFPLDEEPGPRHGLNENTHRLQPYFRWGSYT
jgi:hypothetical protein